MRKITWLFAKERNTDHATFQAKSIFRAFERLQRYWAVDFQQVTRNAQLTFVLTASKKPNPAWQQGRSIFLSANYKWINHEQAVLAVVHEIGHWLVNGGGHVKSPGFVMSEVIGDPFINFMQADMRWFSGLPWSSKLRPWDEPNYFRPRAPLTTELKSLDLCECSVKSWFWDFGFYIFSPKVHRLDL